MKEHLPQLGMTSLCRKPQAKVKSYWTQFLLTQKLYVSSQANRATTSSDDNSCGILQQRWELFSNTRYKTLSCPRSRRISLLQSTLEHSCRCCPELRREHTRPLEGSLLCSTWAGWLLCSCRTNLSPTCSAASTQAAAEPLAPPQQRCSAPAPGSHLSTALGLQ